MKKNKIIKNAGKIVGKKAGNVFNELLNEAERKAIDAGSDFIDDTVNKLSNIGKNSINTITQKVGSIVTKNNLPRKLEPSENLPDENSIPEDEDAQSDVKDDSPVSDDETLKIASDEEDDKFVDSITSDVLVSGIKSIATPAEALTMIDDLVKMTGEVEKFREAQKTKRTAIEAEKDVALARLQAQKELLLEYLDKTFDERKLNFQKYFDVIDDALVKGNTKQLAMGLNSINELAQSSPFKDLANIDQVGKALEDKNYEWDF